LKKGEDPSELELRIALLELKYGIPLIGAVLIKNYASLDKNEKKFHVFFFKLLLYLSKYSKNSVCTQRNRRGTEEEPKQWVSCTN
jgi:hypothetical protein